MFYVFGSENFLYDMARIFCLIIKKNEQTLSAEVEETTALTLCQRRVCIVLQR